ncbi:hypothetical protein BD309DRAFT_975520 [Dichomitus squalens]|nr:hypothetical protein BD309DRAFT_975520 [Dichomitus squalens]
MLANISGGAPGRITEIVSMPSSNTPYGMRRALLILDKHVLLTRTYHKQRHADGQDRFIPISLDALLGTIFIYKEALCRPFAQLCAKELWPTNQAVKARYKSYIFNHLPEGGVPGAFDTDKISSAMKRWTKKHMDIPLGVQRWRQCSTALRRRLGCLQEEEIKGHQTAESMQAGHSHRVDSTHYGVTELSVLGMPEDRIPAFLGASKRWHQRLGLQPGGQLRPLEGPVVTKGSGKRKRSQGS